jgi:hypothetical protein
MKKIIVILAVFLAANISYSQISSIPSSAGGGSSYYQTVQDDGSSLTQRATLNFAGAGIACADDTTKTTCTVTGGSASASSDLTDCKVTYSSGTVISIGACGSQVDNYTTTAIAGCSTSAAPSSSGTLRVYIAQDGTYTLGYSGANTATCTGWTTATSISAFPTGSQPIATITWTTAAWNNDAVDLRRFFRPTPIAAGADMDASTTNGVTTLNPASATIPRKANIQSGALLRCASASGSSPYTCAMSPTLTGYTDGMIVEFEATGTALSGTVNLNIDSIGNAAIKQCDGSTNPASGDIDVGRQVRLTYDGTVFRLPCNPATVTGSGATIYSNTYANLATTNCATGDAFFFQDSLYSAARCTATNTWGQIFVGGKLITVPPSNGSFTAETTGASGTYSLDNAGGTLNIKVGSDEATGVSANYLATLVDSTTFTITIGVDVAVFGGTYPNFRLGVSTGTVGTSDEVTFAIGSLSASGTTPSIGVQKMDNWVFNSWYWGNNLQVGYANRIYMRIRQASGSRHFEYSRDGNTWQVHTTTTSTDHISSPTHYFLAASGNGVASIFHLTNE